LITRTWRMFISLERGLAQRLSHNRRGERNDPDAAGSLALRDVMRGSSPWQVLAEQRATYCGCPATAMELNGALSNLQKLDDLTKCGLLRGRLLMLETSGELAATPMPRRPGVLLETLKQILDQTGGQPLRANQIHGRAQEILGAGRSVVVGQGRAGSSHGQWSSLL